MSADPERLLVRELGLRQLTAHIFNYTVGSGIFVLPAIAVAQLGSAAPLAYLVCATVMALVVMIFMEAGSRVTITGGPYAYVEVGLGPFFGFVTGVLLAVATVTAGGAIAALLGQTAARLLGLEGRWWAAVMTLLLVGALVWVNVRGLRWGARLVEWSTAAKLRAACCCSCWWARGSSSRRTCASTRGRRRHRSRRPAACSCSRSSASSPRSGRPVKCATPRAPCHARSCSRCSPRRCSISRSSWSHSACWDRCSRATPSPRSRARRACSPAMRAQPFLLAGATISMLGWVTGAVLAAPRTFFALARDGFLPRRLAQVHASYHTPHVAIVAYGVIVALVSLTGTFAQLAVVANLAVLAVYALGAVAVLELRRKDVRTDVAPLRIPGGAAGAGAHLRC